ncbi:MAG: aminoacyl-tRNA hydrolase [Acidobacteria bacterium]|nr:aminoacyl-tRNA hydrolase [Acidobacteriota bacterium]
MPAVRLFLGLGNPGSRYRATRHNLGQEVIRLVCRRRGLRLKRKGAARVGSLEGGGGRFLLATPLGYMNESGGAALELAGVLRCAPEEILVLVDDTAIPLGRIRIRSGGSDGGHRGLRSVLQALGTDAVPRLRMGILGEEPPGDVVRFVLEPFLREERPAVDRMVSVAADCVEWILERGLGSAMNEFNRRNRLPTEGEG